MSHHDGGRAPSLTKQPPDTAFKQQRMAAWEPILTIQAVIGLFTFVGVLFLLIGGGIYAASRRAIEYKVQYDGAGTSAATLTQCGISAQDQGTTTCKLTFEIDEDMTAPVYVHYELDNFYQNHRRYIKSYDSAQLLGAVASASALTLCEPLIKNGAQVLNPCGLVANSLFNDVITIETAPSGIAMRETGIAWPADIEERFKQPDGFVSKACASGVCDSAACLGSGYSDGCDVYTDPETSAVTAYWYPKDATTQYLYESYPKVVTPLEGVMNEHFIIWMRTAALPKFRKLYGIIDRDIPKGSTVVFNIDANFNVKGFKGKKSLVLSSQVGVGGTNGALGIAYLITGGVSLVFGLLCLLKHTVSQRPLGKAHKAHVS